MAKTRMYEQGDDWVDLFCEDGGVIRILVIDEAMLDAKYTLWLESNRTRDELLTLTTLAGVPFKIAVGNIANWAIRSPESVANEKKIAKLMDELMAGQSWEE